jgi:hypothetical protein
MSGLRTKVWYRLGQLSAATFLAAAPIVQFGTPPTDLVTQVSHFTYTWHTSRTELLSLHAQARAAHAPYIASLRSAQDQAHVAQADRLEDELDEIQRQVEALPDGEIDRQFPMIGVERLSVPSATSLVPLTTAFAVDVVHMSFTSRTYTSPASLTPIGAITNFASNDNGYSTSHGSAYEIQYDLRYGATPHWGDDTLGYAVEYELLCNWGTCWWKAPYYSLQFDLQPCNARYHTRLWQSPSQSDHIFTVGDAHHDNCQHSCLELTTTALIDFSNAIRPWTSRTATAWGDAFTSPAPCNYYVSGETRIS